MAKITIVSNTTNSSVHRDKKPNLGSSVSHQADLCFVETGNCLGSLRWKVVVSISLRPVDNQDGRRFSGLFSSQRGDDNFVAVISRNSTIFLMDDDGYTLGTMLAPNRIELCYMHVSQGTRLASCSEMIKQP